VRSVYYFLVKVQKNLDLSRDSGVLNQKTQ